MCSLLQQELALRRGRRTQSWVSSTSQTHFGSQATHSWCQQPWRLKPMISTVSFHGSSPSCPSPTWQKTHQLKVDLQEGDFKLLVHFLVFNTMSVDYTYNCVCKIIKFLTLIKSFLKYLSSFPHSHSHSICGEASDVQDPIVWWCSHVTGIFNYQLFYT